MRIGEFNAARRELTGEKDDFVFCGETFQVQQAMPAVLMLQLGASVSGKVDETEGFAAIWEAFRTSLTVPAHQDVPEDDSDFRRFYKLAVDNGCDLESLMRLVMALFEAQAGRPTQQASGSTPGPGNTLPSSNAYATHPGLRSVDDILKGEALTG